MGLWVPDTCQLSIDSGRVTDNVKIPVNPCLKIDLEVLISKNSDIYPQQFDEIDSN